MCVTPADGFMIPQKAIQIMMLLQEPLLKISQMDGYVRFAESAKINLRKSSFPVEQEKEICMKVYRCRVCGEVYIGEKKPASCPFCGAHEAYFVEAGEWKLLKAESLSDASRENLKKALDLEMDNTNFYLAVSKKSKNVFVSSMFKGLSKVEREHASAICKHLGIARPDTKEGSDKAVDSDKANIEESNRREKRAVKFYGEALRQATEPDIKEFFKILSEIESDHIKLTEQELK